MYRPMALPRAAATCSLFAAALAALTALAATPSTATAVPSGETTASVPPPAVKPSNEASPTTALGKTFDTLPVQSSTGDPMDLAKVPGWKVVYFWSPLCPCVRNCQNLSLFPLSREYKEKGVRFFAVASNATNVRTAGGTGRGRASLVLSSGAGQMPPFAIVLDPGHRAADKLGASRTPQTFLLDPQNRVVFVGNPDDSEEILEKTGRAGEMTQNYLGDALRDALAGRPVARPTSPILGCDILRVNPGAFN